MRIARRLRPAAAALLAGAGLAASLLVATPASAGEILSVKGESANFREGPGEKHPILFAADRYYPVEVLEKKDGWARVKDFEGDEAWVAARLLSSQETVVVEEDRVNVRDGSSTSAEIVFKAERGEVFKVEQRQGKWLKVVDAAGDGGWIREDMVWGERGVAASSSKGKTKGELDAPASGGSKEKDGGKGDAAKGKGRAAPKSADQPKADAAGDAKGKAAPEKQAAAPEGEPTEAEPKASAETEEAPQEAQKEAAAQEPGKGAEEKAAPAAPEAKEAPVENDAPADAEPAEADDDDDVG